MDKAHEKELSKNDLEASLEKVAAAVRPYYIPAAVIAAILIVGAIGYMLYERSVRQANTVAWSKLITAVFDRNANPESLRRVSEDLGDTPASYWALQLAADDELRQGSLLLFDDREAAQDRLQSALELYEKVIKGASNDPMLQIRARYGAAQANECLFKLDEAIELYQQIVDSKAGSGAIARAAEERLKTLKNSDTRDFYKWFATVEPYKPSVDTGRSGSGLNSLPSLPDLPNFSVPGADTPPATPDAPPAGTDPAAPAAGDRDTTPSRFGDEPSGEPAKDEPKQDEPGADEPAATEPAADEPSGDEPKSDEPASSDPPASEPNSSDPPQP